MNTDKPIHSGEIPDPFALPPERRRLLRRLRRSSQTAGFSIVETVLSLGVLAFAIVPLVGLLPIGLTTFRKAMNTSVTTQISQQIVNEAQETDFSTYVATAPAIRYFDEQGEELTGSGGSAPAGAIYQVNVRVASSPTLPGAGPANENLAILTIQIANDPGNIALPINADGLWSPGSSPSISLVAYSTVIAGNYTSVTN